jgi:YegS/Rv2252/BmrU family lipid kinase
MRATVIINPVAGPGRARTMAECVAVARSILERAGFDVDVRITTGGADPQRFALNAVASGCELVVAWGGDGTVNGAASALAGSNVPLAIIPGGSGNGLARDLGLPRDPGAAFGVAAARETRTIDAGDLNGSLFFNVAGIGLDACIARRMAAPGARRGLLGYAMATLHELPGYAAQDYTITIPAESGAPLETHALFIALANSRQYGSGAQIAPLASLDDGVLDIVVVKPQSAFRIAARLPGFFRGTLAEDATLLMRTASHAEITAAAPICFHVDGEPREAAATLVLRTRPRTLRVCVSSVFSAASPN